MANCNNCNKKIGLFTKSEKIISDVYCIPCFTSLGYKDLMAIKSSLMSADEAANPEKYFSGASQLIKILNERKPLYDQMAVIFKPTRVHRYLNLHHQLDIEIDDESQMICIIKTYDKSYIRFSDFLDFTPGAGQFYYLKYKKIFGNEGFEQINTTAKDFDQMRSFFDGLKPKN